MEGLSWGVLGVSFGVLGLSWACLELSWSRGESVLGHVKAMNMHGVEARALVLSYDVSASQKHFRYST